MVRRTKSSSSSPPHLPTLDVAGSRAGSTGGSANLRGAHHAKIPDIANNQPLNTLLPVFASGAHHPEPYYITQNVVLKVGDQRPPWLSAQKAGEKGLLDMWKNNGKFRDRFLDEFIKDALYLEVSGLCSGAVTGALGRNKSEAKALEWLENHVVTDVAYQMVESLAFEAMWNEARKLSRDDADDLDAEYGDREVDPAVTRVLRANYSRPAAMAAPEASAVLAQCRFYELVYHLNRLMQKGSLVENYAIRKLQEQIITQVACKVVLDEALRFMEHEMSNLDEEERVDNPPRAG